MNLCVKSVSMGVSLAIALGGGLVAGHSQWMKVDTNEKNINNVATTLSSINDKVIENEAVNREQAVIIKSTAMIQQELWKEIRKAQ